MVRWVVRLIPHDGPIELLLVVLHNLKVLCHSRSFACGAMACWTELS